MSYDWYFESGCIGTAVACLCMAGELGATIVVKQATLLSIAPTNRIKCAPGARSVSTDVGGGEKRRSGVRSVCG